jgi:hypothetical protein
VTSGAVTQVDYKHVSHMNRLTEEWEAHVLDGGVVWSCSSGDVGESGSSRLALHNSGTPLHPHGQMVSDFWLAVPGLDGAFTSVSLGSHKSRDIEQTSTRISPPREQALRE